MAPRRRRWAGAKQDAPAAIFLTGLAAMGTSAMLAAWLAGGRGLLVVLGLASSFLFPYAALIQWRDFRAGVMRHGPGLRWHVTRERQPLRFWMISIGGALLVPVAMAMWALIWWGVFSGAVR